MPCRFGFSEQALGEFHPKPLILLEIPYLKTLDSEKRERMADEDKQAAALLKALAGSGKEKKSGFFDIDRIIAGSQRRWKWFVSRFLGVLLIAGVIFLLITSFFYFTSDAGKRKIQQIGEIVRNYNPITIYKNQVLIASQTGNIWTSESNFSQMQAGLLFKEFTAVGSAEIPKGSPFSAKYVIDIENADLPPTLIAFKCYIKTSGKLATEIVVPDAVGGAETAGDVLPEGALDPTDSSCENCQPRVIPESEIEVAGKSFRENVRCLVPPEATEQMEGVYSLAGRLSFPFSTKNVKLNVYFTTDENLQKEGIDYMDFFKEYKIQESQPIRAVYNGEPVEIGIGVSTENEQPVLIDDSSVIGITLTNRWSGIVTKIEDLTISLPEGTTINQELNRNPNTICPFVATGSSRGRNEYNIDDNFKTVEIKKGFSKSFECYLKLDESILGPGEIYTKKSYLVSADYFFETEEKTTTFTVKKASA